jgi:hypothetical protein
MPRQHTGLVYVKYVIYVAINCYIQHLRSVHGTGFLLEFSVNSPDDLERVKQVGAVHSSPDSESRFPSHIYIWHHVVVIIISISSLASISRELSLSMSIPP